MTDTIRSGWFASLSRWVIEGLHYGNTMEGQYDYDSRGLSRKLIRIAIPYWRLIIPMLLLQVLVGVSEAVGISSVIPFLQTIMVSGNENIDISPNASWVIRVYQSLFSELSSVQRIKWLAILLMGATAVRVLCSLGAAWFQNLVQLRISESITSRLFAGYMHADYQFFLDRRQGKMLSDLLEEPKRASYAISLYVGWIQGFFQAVLLVLLLLAISWQITLAVAGAGVVALLFYQLFKARASEIGKAMIINRRDMASLASEVISGIRQVKLFSSERRIAANFSSLLSTLKMLQMRNALLTLLPDQVLRFAMGVGGGAILFAAVLFWPGRIMPLLAVGATVFVISARLLPQVAFMGAQRLKLYVHIPTLDFILAAVDDEGQFNKDELRDGSQTDITSLKGDICFESVSFAYQESVYAHQVPTWTSWVDRGDNSSDAQGTMLPSTGNRASELVLNACNMTFRQGEMTAIVGPSGAGKTTAVDLIVRLFEPQSGRITFGGVDVREFSKASWRRAIGFVSQETFIFHGTIRDNIAFGKTSATDEEIWRAARDANAHDFISRLPDGYSTVVGDRGLKLSGGQRQRVAIARALVRQPQILVFDEATSALDNESELAVQVAIDGVSRDRTVIVIAHRLSTVRNADKIVVIDMGHVVEEGTHEQLLKSQGLFWRLTTAVVN